MTDHDDVPTIHTLKTDAAEAWTHDRKTVLDLAAVNENRKAESPFPHSRTLLHVGIGIVVVLILGVGGYFGFQYLNRPIPIVIPPRPTPIISGDADSTIMLTNDQSTDLLANIQELQRSRLPDGSLREVVLSFGEGDTTQYADRSKLLSMLGIAIPQDLESSLTNRATFFLYYGEDDGVAFVFETTDARSALSGLLAWENTLLPTLSRVFQVRAPVSAYDYRDELLNNIDIRHARTAAGEAFGGHAIVSGKIIVVASSDAALSRVLNRVLNGPVQ